MDGSAYSGDVDSKAGTLKIITGNGIAIEARLSALMRTDNQQQGWGDWAVGKAGIAWECTRTVEAWDGKGAPAARLSVRCSGWASGKANRLLELATMRVGGIVDEAIDDDDEEGLAFTKDMSIEMRIGTEEAVVTYEVGGDDANKPMYSDLDDISVTYRIIVQGAEITACFCNMTDDVKITTRGQLDPVLALLMAFVLARLTRASAEKKVRIQMEEMVEMPLVGYALG